MQSQPLSWKVIIGLILAPFLFLLVLIVGHDYFYPNMSDFSSVENEAGVQATLENELIIGHSTIDTTLAVLAEHGVEACVQPNETLISCYTSKPTKILDLKNLRIRSLGYLMMGEEYDLRFRFEANRLIEIRVRYIITGP